MFLRSIKLQPNKGASKYMNMGQLESGIRALEYYRQGIKILLQEKALIERGEVSSYIFFDILTYSYYVNRISNLCDYVVMNVERSLFSVSLFRYKVILQKLIELSLLRSVQWQKFTSLIHGLYR